jgi:type II secretory ATPase GspE/PulE/Tfp pilus assembly ATPase PilB-like protein
VQSVLHDQKRMVLVAGMDESGKTTMLYTMLDHITGPHNAVATVEESIEFRLPRVHQAVTRPELGLGASALLRAALRQDPDAVMVAHLDEDSLSLAQRAAQRGVFMLGGLQARSAGQAADMAPGAKLVVALRLMRRLGRQAATRPLIRAEAELLEGKVRFAKVLSALKEEGVVHEHTAWKDIVFYTAANANGYSGMAGIQEVLRPGFGNETERLTLLEDALFKAVQGRISIDDVVEMAAE